MNLGIVLAREALGKFISAQIEKLVKFMLSNSLKTNSTPRR
jgi:hypothetical protein